MLAHFPCSIAAKVEKRPVGELHVAVVAAPNPNYTFDPAIFTDSPEAQAIGHKLVLPPGPKNQVGVEWIGLDKPGYGMHGTPNPEQIGRSESHGCFRLANWDAEYLREAGLDRYARVRGTVALMPMKKILLFVALFAVASFAVAQPSVPVGNTNSAARIQWWRDAKFGLFIHFGLYAIPGRGEWVQWKPNKFPSTNMQKLADQFNPTNFTPDSWAELAKAAGMKYVVLSIAASRWLRAFR